MGALAPNSSWKPEDDILLKNAVEAGASLESLAKGAVQFSRKFTVRELQDRWHSLLYDPIISAEAAFHMMEFERSASTIPSKFRRTGNPKDNKHVSGKRKAESVRSCYYALRKRIRNEPRSSLDLSFLIASTDDNYMDNEGEPFSANCMLADPASTHFGHQESNLDIMHHAFSGIRDEAAGNSFQPHFHNAVQGNYPLEEHNVHEEIQHIHGENVSQAGNKSVICEFSGPNQLPENIYQDNECSKFEGEHMFGSPMMDCAASFHNLEYSSPLPEMPIWRTVEGVSPPSIPLNMHSDDTFSSLPCNDNTNSTCLSGYDVHGDSNLELEIPSEDMKNVAANTEGYLAELSNSLLNFTNEEELMFTDDGKDVIDKSYLDGLSSLLLNSPNDANQDPVPDTTEPKSSLTTDHIANSCGSSHGELDSYKACVVGGDVDKSERQLPEMCAEIICTLNTEDPEIPCNDDVVFSSHLRAKSFASVARRNLHDASKPSIKEFSGIPETAEVVPVSMKRDIDNLVQSHTSSQIVRSQSTTEIVSAKPVSDHGVKFDLPSSSNSHANGGVAYDGASQINRTNSCSETLLAVKPKEETQEVVLIKFNQNIAESSLEKQALGTNGCKCYPQTIASDVKQDPDAPSRSQNHQAAHVKLGSADFSAPEQVADEPVSDPEEPIESDDEVPYFSDIEAMILDMDLDPEDQDLYSSEEVLRYQQEDTKRLIIRLEQGAQSYMQRAIASEGAFAVLYGRCSKHYIKKPEVLLGRSTEDIIVDIDLGVEGRANKISRRQATISLDKKGSFHLKNLGKFSISVNDKEIGPGQSQTLASSCLIEIRGMPFIFETSEARVKQYLDGMMQKN